MKFILLLLMVFITACGPKSNKSKIANTNMYDVAMTLKEFPKSDFSALKSGGTLDVVLFDQGGNEVEIVQGEVTHLIKDASLTVDTFINFKAPDSTGFVKVNPLVTDSLNCTFDTALSSTGRVVFADILDKASSGFNDDKAIISAACSQNKYKVKVNISSLEDNENNFTVGMGSVGVSYKQDLKLDAKKKTESFYFTAEPNGSQQIAKKLEINGETVDNPELEFCYDSTDPFYRKLKDDYLYSDGIYRANCNNSFYKVLVSDAGNQVCKLENEVGSLVYETTMYDPLIESDYLKSDSTLTFQVLKKLPEVTIKCAYPDVDLNGTIRNLRGTISVGLEGGKSVDISSDTIADKSFSLKGATRLYSDYSIAITKQPDHQICKPTANDTGKMVQGNIDGIEITCEYNNYTVTGTISGNGGGTVTVTDGSTSADGTETITFTRAAYSDLTLAVTSSPAGKDCAVNPSESTLFGLTSNATFKVTCTNSVVSGGGGGGGGAPTTYTVGGNITIDSDVAGDISIKNNGGDELIRFRGMVGSGAPFTFATAVNSAGTYSITAVSNTAGELCKITNGTGTVATANITNITVACIKAKRMYITTDRGAPTGGISGADSICMSDANKPTGSATWKAFIVDSSNRTAKPSLTDWVLSATARYVRANDFGLIGTTDIFSIFGLGGSGLNGSFGGVTHKAIWTGLNGDWTSSTDNCSNWTDNTNTNGASGIFGATGTNFTGATAIANGSQTCNYTGGGMNPPTALLCVEQ